MKLLKIISDADIPKFKSGVVDGIDLGLKALLGIGGFVSQDSVNSQNQYFRKSHCAKPKSNRLSKKKQGAKPKNSRLLRKKQGAKPKN